MDTIRSPDMRVVILAGVGLGVLTAILMMSGHRMGSNSVLNLMFGDAFGTGPNTGDPGCDPSDMAKARGYVRQLDTELRALRAGKDINPDFRIKGMYEREIARVEREKADLIKRYGDCSAFGAH